jgi:predicted ester cyclase
VVPQKPPHPHKEQTSKTTVIKHPESKSLGVFDMSIEENKAVFGRFIEAYNTHNLDLLDDLVSEDYVDPEYPQMKGLKGLKQMMRTAFSAFPDYHETIEDIISEDNKLWILLRYTGTHKGEFMGLAPTGKQVTSTVVDMYRLENGKIVWGKRVPTPDLAFFMQLGLVQYTEKGKQLFQASTK